MTAETLHLKYVDEVFDKNGYIKDYKLKCPVDYNFAYDVMDEMAKIEPDRMALIWCNPNGEEHVFTYGDLKKYSDKTANMLKAKGISKGDKVMLILKRHYEFWFSMLALHKLGAVPIPATFLLTKHDIVYRVNASSIKAIICTSDGEVAEHVEAALPECPTLETKIIVRGNRDGWYNFTQLMEASSENFERVPNTSVNDTLLLYFSSGTTGNPKMVEHKQTYSLGHLVTAKYWHNVEPDGIHLTISDSGWGKAVWGKFYGQFLMGTTVFVYDFDKFVSADILEKVSKYKINTLCCPPTMFRFLMQEDVKSYDLSSLHYCTIAGEALSPDVFNNWYNQTGIKLMEGFGQTETTLMIANLQGMNPKPGSMGKPVPPGVTGEIVIKSSWEDWEENPFGLYKGYYLDDNKTKESWHDGFYHTGDTAWMDEDGYYWYVGRTDDIIKSSGYRIGPFEIESVLLEHPAVMECAVTGVPDEIRGNLVKATIVLRKGFEPSDELVTELQAFVKKETAPYKYPRVIDFVSELPKTTNGKVRRAEIRKNDIQKGTK